MKKSTQPEIFWKGLEPKKFGFLGKMNALSSHVVKTEKQNLTSGRDIWRSRGTSLNHLEEFINSYCHQDSLLLLNIISNNTNNVIATEIIYVLWDNWKIMQPVEVVV